MPDNFFGVLHRVTGLIPYFLNVAFLSDQTYAKVLVLA